MDTSTIDLNSRHIYRYHIIVSSQQTNSTQYCGNMQLLHNPLSKEYVISALVVIYNNALILTRVDIN